MNKNPTTIFTIIIVTLAIISYASYNGLGLKQQHDPKYIKQEAATSRRDIIGGGPNRGK